MCVPQNDPFATTRAIRAIPIYEALSDVFLVVQNPLYWTRAWCSFEAFAAWRCKVPRMCQVDEGGVVSPFEIDRDHVWDDPRECRLTNPNDRHAIDYLVYVVSGGYPHHEWRWCFARNM